MSGKQVTLSDEQLVAVRPHQPGQDVFRAILSEDIDWKPFPAFPPSVRLAVVVGDPSKDSPYTIRVRVPHNVKLMPHRHSREDRGFTRSSPASSTSGWATSSTPTNSRRIRRAAWSCCPATPLHFHWAKSSEYITQVTAIGPLGLELPRPQRTIRATNRDD